METFYFHTICPSSRVKDVCAFATSGTHTPAEHWESASRDLSARRVKATDGERERWEKDGLICCKNVNTRNKKKRRGSRDPQFDKLIKSFLLTNGKLLHADPRNKCWILLFAEIPWNVMTANLPEHKTKRRNFQQSSHQEWHQTDSLAISVCSMQMICAFLPAMSHILMPFA